MLLFGLLSPQVASRLLKRSRPLMEKTRGCRAVHRPGRGASTMGPSVSSPGGWEAPLGLILQ